MKVKYVLDIMGGGGERRKKFEQKQITGICRIQVIFSQRQKLIVFKANNCHLHLCNKNDMMQDYNCFYQDNLNIIKVKNLLTFFKKKVKCRMSVYIC